MWPQIAMLVISYAISALTRPKPAAPKPASLADFELPVPDEGTPQCVVFGDCWSSDWQVLSYGNLRSHPVRSKGGK